jgi:bifunctional aspartokinase / homoserine dehydrogenase 1
MRILKFGGSSVGTPERLRAAAAIIQQARAERGPVAVVVSAFHGVTDQLLALAERASHGEDCQPLFAEVEQRHLGAVKELLPVQRRSPVLTQVKLRLNELADLLHGVALVGELSPRTRDAIAAFGERLSAAILAAHLAADGCPAEYLDTRPLIRSDAHFGAARVLTDETYQAIRAHFATHLTLQIATGFIAATTRGETTTLGRGGSDYTASIFGAALAAEEIEIWSDVDGVMSADPRKVPTAFTLPGLTYQEAMELAHFGAKVIYPPTMRPAMRARIPIRIKNTLRPEAAGTAISDRREPHAFPVTGLTSAGGIALARLEGAGMIGVPGVAARLFGALARRQISVILITQASSEHTICFAVTADAAQVAADAIADEFAPEIQLGQIDAPAAPDECAIIAAVGEGMRQRPGIAGTLFQALGAHGVNVIAIAQGSSELNISAVVAQADETAALRAIHAAFFGPSPKELT